MSPPREEPSATSATFANIRSQRSLAVPSAGLTHLDLDGSMGECLASKVYVTAKLATPESTIERWAAQRKAPIIVDLMRGQISVPKAARKRGFTQNEDRRRADQSHRVGVQVLKVNRKDQGREVLKCRPRHTALATKAPGIPEWTLRMFPHFQVVEIPPRLTADAYEPYSKYAEVLPVRGRLAKVRVIRIKQIKAEEGPRFPPDPNFGLRPNRW